jgi:hypothetical protein
MDDPRLYHTSTITTSTIMPRGALTLAVKTHLSVNHIIGASLFARLCGAIEQATQGPPSQDIEIEHRSYAIGAPIEAVAFLEAAINELYVAAGDKDPHIFGAADSILPELMDELWGELEGASILRKFQTTLVLAKKPKFDLGTAPMQSVGNLVALRNALVHYKPEWDNELKGHKSIEDRLRTAFPPNPFAAKDKAFFPSKCLGYGCAAWSIRTAWGFIKDFYARLGLPYWAVAHEPRILSI